MAGMASLLGVGTGSSSSYPFSVAQSVKMHGQLPLSMMTVTDMESDPTRCFLYVDHPFKSFILQVRLPPSLPPYSSPTRGFYCLCLLSVFIPPDSHYLTSSLPPVFSLQTPRIIPLSPVIVSGAPRTSHYGTIHARKRQ